MRTSCGACVLPKDEICFHDGCLRQRDLARIEELEIALRAALSFIQERHTDHNDGHAQMVIAAVRGALRKVRD
jgi:hypothetical protein